MSGSRRVLADLDLFRLNEISDPQCSPVDRRIAYVLTGVLPDGSGYTSAVWLLEGPDGRPRQLTSGDVRDWSPRWSPDGRSLAFLRSAAGDPAQVWLLDVDSGKTRQLTAEADGADEVSWSPDGREIAFTAGVPGSILRADALSSVQVVRCTVFKADSSGILDGSSYRQVWTVPVSGGWPRQITYGQCHHSSPTWSPSGEKIAFVADRSADPDPESHTDIYVVPRSGEASGGPRGALLAHRLTSGDRVCGAPAYSPDGSTLAYITRRPHRAASYWNIYDVWMVSSSGATPPVRLTGDVDLSGVNAPRYPTRVHAAYRSPAPVWGPDGDCLYFLASTGGATALLRLGIQERDLKVIAGGPREVFAFSPAPDRSVVFAACDAAHPGDLYRCSSGCRSSVSGAERALTECNRDLLAEVILSRPERLTVTGSGGATMTMWVTKPQLPEPGRSYPAVVMAGTPMGAYSFSFDLQLLSARGFAVCYVPLRSPAGYRGEMDDPKRLQVETDLNDVLSGADAVAGQSYIDASRIGIMGKDYAALLAGLLLCREGRFSAGVVERCISNLLSLYGTSDTGRRWVESEFRADPWAAPQTLKRLSPLFSVPGVHVPTLVIHSDEDQRVPLEQAEQMFVALRKTGVKTRFVRFLGEGHNLAEGGMPVNRLERLLQIAGWLHEHLS